VGSISGEVDGSSGEMMRRHAPRPRESPFREFTDLEYARQEQLKLEAGSEILQVQASEKEGQVVVEEEEEEDDDEEDGTDQFFTPENDQDGSTTGHSPREGGYKTRRERLRLTNARLEVKFSKFESEGKALAAREQDLSLLLAAKRKEWTKKHEDESEFGVDPASVQAAMRNRLEKKAEFLGRCWVLGGRITIHGRLTLDSAPFIGAGSLAGLTSTRSRRSGR